MESRETGTTCELTSGNVTTERGDTIEKTSEKDLNKGLKVSKLVLYIVPSRFCSKRIDTLDTNEGNYKFILCFFECLGSIENLLYLWKSSARFVHLYFRHSVLLCFTNDGNIDIILLFISLGILLQYIHCF